MPAALCTISPLPSARPGPPCRDPRFQSVVKSSRVLGAGQVGRAGLLQAPGHPAASRGPTLPQPPFPAGSAVPWTQGAGLLPAVCRTGAGWSRPAVEGDFVHLSVLTSVFLPVSGTMFALFCQFARCQEGGKYVQGAQMPLEWPLKPPGLGGGPQPPGTRGLHGAWPGMLPHPAIIVAFWVLGCPLPTELRLVPCLAPLGTLHLVALPGSW